MAINKELMAHFEEMGKEREQTREEIERINNFEGDIDLYRSIDKQEAELEDIKKRVIQDISVKLLDDYPDNHFRITEGEEWDEFVESIRTAGIMTPLAVRKKGARYEVLSGHRRKKAAIEAGLDTVPCEVRIADDVEASVIVGTTNNYRKDISAREWGWAYRTTYEALKKAVGRPKGETGENVPSVGTLNNQSGRTVDVVAEKYGVGKGTVQNKIRLTYLTDDLYQFGVECEWPQAALIDLSYLSEASQNVLLVELPRIGNPMNADMAASLRASQQNKGDLTPSDIIDAIPKPEPKEKEPKAPRPKRYTVRETLFPDDLKKGMREAYIDRALEYIKENGIEISVIDTLE